MKAGPIGALADVPTIHCTTDPRRRRCYNCYDYQGGRTNSLPQNATVRMLASAECDGCSHPQNATVAHGGTSARIRRMRRLLANAQHTSWKKIITYTITNPSRQTKRDLEEARSLHNNGNGFFFLSSTTSNCCTLKKIISINERTRSNEKCAKMVVEHYFIIISSANKNFNISPSRTPLGADCPHREQDAETTLRHPLLILGVEDARPVVPTDVFQRPVVATDVSVPTRVPCVVSLSTSETSGGKLGRQKLLGMGRNAAVDGGVGTECLFVPPHGPPHPCYVCDSFHRPCDCVINMTRSTSSPVRRRDVVAIRGREGSSSCSLRRRRVLFELEGRGPL